MAFKLIRSVWEPETGHVKEFICAINERGEKT